MNATLVRPAPGHEIRADRYGGRPLPSPPGPPDGERRPAAAPLAPAGSGSTPHSDVGASLSPPVAAIDAAAVERLIADDDWWVQPAPAGPRVLVRKDGDVVTASGPGGSAVRLPAAVVAAVRLIDAGACLLDGALVGDAYHCSDLLGRGGTDLRPLPYAARYDAALDLVDPVPADALRHVETATTRARKRALVGRLRRERAAGVVFRHRLAPWAAEWPAAAASVEPAAGAPE